MRPTELAHRLIRGHVNSGDTVVDATVGNGHDTLFLANCVGESGKVHGFDIQQQAIESTGLRTAECPQVELHQIGHEKMDTVVDSKIAAAMFNLGYLPSGDKAVITRPQTTLLAIQKALDLLASNGLITIVVYPGHEGGESETDAIGNWITSQKESEVVVANYRSEDSPSHAPYLIEIRKMA